MRKERPPLTPEQRALGLLARREHSARELSRKLQQKGVEKLEAEQVVERFGERELQSDERFADTLVRRRAGDGYGPARIRAELSSHGIGRDAVQRALSDADVDWIGVARRHYQRRFGPADAADRKELQKRLGWLAQRGFDGATIRAVTSVDLDE